MRSEFSPYNNRQIAGGADLPLSPSTLPKTEVKLDSEFVSLRYSVRTVDDQDILHLLRVVAKHPKLKGHERTFDMSHLLPEALRTSPVDIQRVIEPGLPMEARLTALKSILHRISPDAVVPPVADFPIPPTHHDSTTNELEPILTFQPTLFTSLLDALSGVSMRGVTVNRNHEPFLQFRVTEDSKGHVSAHVVVVQTSLELPLLDRKGQPVVDYQADTVIHDLTHLLYQKRNATSRRLLIALGNELQQRQNHSAQSFTEGISIDFKRELLDSARRIVSDRMSNINSPSRELPDNRFLWIEHTPTPPIFNEVRFVCNSITQEPYELRLEFSGATATKVRAACDAILKDEGVWPSFAVITKIFSQYGGSRFDLKYPNDILSYPRRVNELVESLEHNPAISCSRGTVLYKNMQEASLLPYYLREFARGLIPISARVQGDSLATTWFVQGFFDETLCGRMFIRNELGGEFILNTEIPYCDECKRKTEIQHVFSQLAHGGYTTLLRRGLNSVFRCRRANLPDDTLGDILAYGSIETAALICLDALRIAGLSSKTEDTRWVVKQVNRGHWSLSLFAPMSQGQALPYIINMQVSDGGVWEVAYSRGHRGPLGGLVGRRIFSRSSTGYFLDKELQEVLLTICKDGSITNLFSELKELHGLSADVSVFTLAPLREIDPEKDTSDILVRLWNLFASFYH